jgi:hypothetical protein
MSEATDSAVEAKEKNRNIALIIAVLALLLVLAWREKRSTPIDGKNIESSDLYY